MKFDLNKEYALKAEKEFSNDDYDDEFKILSNKPERLNDDISEDEIINEIINVSHKSSNIHIINKIFSVIFIVIIGIFCLGNFISSSASSLINSFEVNNEKTLSKNDAYSIEKDTLINNYNNSIIYKDEIKSFYGYTKNLKNGSFQFNNITEDIYKDKTNRLTYICQYTDIAPYAEKIKQLNEKITEKGSYFLYVQEPFKILKNEVNNEKNNLYYSLKDYSNSNADNMVASLTTFNVKTYDLRNILTESNRILDPMFFFTDSRWTNDTAFKSYLNISDILTTDGKAKKESFKLFSDYNNFSYTVEENAFIGNQGAVLGDKYLNKKDNFDLFIPYARTSFKVETIKADGTIIEKEGDFSKAILTKPTQKSNLFDTYLGAPAPKIKITNNLNNYGEKLLIIGDDFVNPLGSFLSLNFSETVIINPLLYKDSINKFIDENDFNYVIMAYNPKSFNDEKYFNFD